MRRQSGRHLWVALLSSTLFSCGPGFDPSSLVDELRVLAIRAEPAEVLPGQTFSYRALVANPQADAQPLIFNFVQCTPSAEGCLEYSEALERSGGDEAAAQNDYNKTSIRFGLDFGSATTLEPVGANLTASTSILEGASNPEEGENAQGNFIICKGDACGSESAEAFGADALLALKRVRISQSESPNHNPEISGLRYGSDVGEPGDELVANQGRFPVQAQVPVSLWAELPESAVESYAYLNDDGQVEDREERPYLRWYATGGEFEASTSALEFNDDEGVWQSEVRFLPPAQELWPENGLVLYAIIWDRRGGLGWITVEGFEEES